METAAIAGGRIRSDHRDEEKSVLGRPGSDLLFQALRLSTIGAEEFNGRVRDGNGFRLLARTTRSAKDGFASKRSFASRANAQSSGLTRGPRAANAWSFFQCRPFFRDCRVKPGNDEE